MILVDPCYRPVPALPVYPAIKPTHREPQNQIDRDILALLRDEPEPVGTWSVVNRVAELYPANSRTERRTRRMEVLRRINPLVRGRLVRRLGRSYLSLA